MLERAGHVHFVRAHDASATGHPQVDYVRLYASRANRASLDQLKNPKVDHFGYDWEINNVNAPVAAGKFIEKEGTP